MTFTRKPVFTPTPEQQQAIVNAVQKRLCAATAAGAQETGGTGASFVIIGIGVWAAELAELDGNATAKFFRAVADIFDPRTNDAQKRRADKDRSQAVRALYAALDLDMADVGGHA